MPSDDSQIRLTAEVPADWMNIFNVPDNAAVDESAEADTYAVGLRETFAPDLSGGTLNFSLGSAHEIVRLSFAKTAAGAHEIAGWSEGSATDLSGLGVPPALPVCDPAKPGHICQDDDETLGDDLAALAEALGTGGGVSVLLALLFLL